MNTVNFDGQWTRRVIERLGFGTAQGSSSRGAIEGLTVMAQRIKEGKHVAFTIDGPRGPRYVAKPGPVILARRTGSPIAVFHIGLQRAYTFKKSWDLFQIPFPFTRAVMFFAPAVRIPIDAGSEVLHQKQAEMQAALEKVRDAAESLVSTECSRNEKQVRATWNRRRSASRGLKRSCEAFILRPSFTGTFICLPSRTIVSVTVLPGCERFSIRFKSIWLVIALPSTAISTSPPMRNSCKPATMDLLPPRIPACAAAPPGSTRSIKIPCCTFSFSASARPGHNARPSAPRVARRTRPYLIKSSATRRAVLIGIANPIPAVVPVGA